MLIQDSITSATAAHHVAQIIQIAVAPVFLLAGLGAFLNVCSMRLARIVDRGRELETAALSSRDQSLDRLKGELLTLRRRKSIVTGAIFLTVLSAVLICILVVLLFGDPFIERPLGVAIALLFMASIISIGVGFLFFMAETWIGSHMTQFGTHALEQLSEDAPPK